MMKGEAAQRRAVYKSGASDKHDTQLESSTV